MYNGKVFKVATLGCQESGGMVRDKKSDHFIGEAKFRKEYEILDLVACWDPDERNAKACAEAWGIRSMSLEEVWADKSIEIVQVCGSPSQFNRVARLALEHGKHVSCSKMIGISFEDGKELCELARSKNLRLASAPDCFLSGSMQTARYLVDKGITGKIRSGVISLSRNVGILGEELPYLYQKGMNILYDMSGYYLYSLCNILGGVRRVTAFGTRSEDQHVVRKIDSDLYQQSFPLEDYDILTAVLEMDSGALVTVHLNGASIQNQLCEFNLFGEKGVLNMGHPHDFNIPVVLRKPGCEPIEFPLIFGFQDYWFYGALGMADMAWGIVNNRPHRAGPEFSLHLLELVWGIEQSAQSGAVYEMTTHIERPVALQEGYVGDGFFLPTEEGALADMTGFKA